MFRVKCPICKGILTIDTRTRKVVGHTSAEDAQKSSEERFESIADSLRKAKNEQASRLEAAKEREAAREAHLDNLFKKAREKAEEAGDDGRPLGPVWD